MASISDYMDGMPTTGGLADIAASTPLKKTASSGGGFNAQGIAELGGALGTLGGGLGGIIRSFGGGDDDDDGFGGLGNPFDPKYADEARAKVDTEYGKLLEQLGGCLLYTSPSPRDS